LSWIYLVFGTVPAVAGIFYGIKPAVTAIVVHAAWRIGSRVLHNAFLWSLATAAFIAVFAFSLPFPAIVLSAGIMGLLAARYTPAWLQAAKANDRPVVAASPAWLDDDRRPPHVNFHWGRFRRYLLIGLGCWAGGLAGLALAGGWHGVFTQMGWFFTKAALLTFGGAYAVLPYVYQGAVIDHHWLTGAQMIDGLALGETTPGPLIMVVAFVGFVGAWQQQVLGPDQLLLAGMLGATVATFFTFLPSFLFILLGGPLVEATHGDLKFTAPLSAVTAAVVGVILNLALFFAGHVLWPAGLVGPFEWPALLLGVAAFIALFGWRFNVIAVIGGCGLAGLGYFLVLR
jgi:chromate transporter